MRLRRSVTAALLLLLGSSPSALAGTLTLPFADPHPRITSWMDHHYPIRQEDGIMIRFDGATGYPYDGHRGTDFAISSDTPVVAADEGTVVYADWSDSGGWGVVVEHAIVKTAYFHNNALLVYPGQHVNRGQLLALSGSTGNSTGPHLHFEVRDLLDPWHAVDPFGWTGSGPDPWHWDMGYLWTTDPPNPFVLPLAFLGGARWNYWYGLDGAPPAVTWQIRDGGRGVTGYAAQWEVDPGPNAPRAASRQGSAAFPGPGAHTLHLRLFDGAGASADVTYLYLYDVGRPNGEVKLGDARSTAIPLGWTAHDDLSGVRQITVEVADAPGKPFRPWVINAPPASQSAVRGAFRFFAEPGAEYQFRLTVRNAARNASIPVIQSAAVPAATPRPASVLDREILGTLPDLPPGSAEPAGVRQEHPLGQGGVIVSTDGALHGVGAAATPAVTPPVAGGGPMDLVMQPAGPLLLLADGTTWSSQGGFGPRFKAGTPVRLLQVGDGGLLVLDAHGVLTADKNLSLSPSPSSVVSLVDAGVFQTGNGGLTLDSDGSVHAFGDAASIPISLLPGAWVLAGAPTGIALAGTARAPAGLLLDAKGGRQPFGSVLLLPDSLFTGPTFDPLTGLVVR